MAKHEAKRTDESFQTPDVVISYPKLFKQVNKTYTDPTSKLVYKCIMLFPPDSDMSALEAAVQTVLDQNGWTMEDLKRQGAMPWKRASEEKYPKQAGWLMLDCWSKDKPVVLDRDADVDNPLTEETAKDKIYGGAICRAMLHAYSYNSTNGPGINISFTAFQFIAKGEPFGDGTGGSDPVRDARGFTPVEPGKMTAGAAPAAAKTSLFDPRC